MVKGAVRLFIEKGFHRTTTREIAKESGFSIGTLYEYIGAKEDILYLVCDSIYDEFSERLAGQLGKGGTALERLKKAISAYFQIVDSMKDEVLVMYQETKSLPKEALPYVLRKELAMADVIESIVRECVETGEISLEEPQIKLMAHNILVQGQMWAFRRWALQKEFTFEEYATLQIQQLLSEPLASANDSSSRKK